MGYAGAGRVEMGLRSSQSLIPDVGGGRGAFANRVALFVINLCSAMVFGSNRLTSMRSVILL